MPFATQMLEAYCNTPKKRNNNKQLQQNSVQLSWQATRRMSNIILIMHTQIRTELCDILLPTQAPANALTAIGIICATIKTSLHMSYARLVTPNRTRRKTHIKFQNAR